MYTVCRTVHGAISLTTRHTNKSPHYTSSSLMVFFFLIRVYIIMCGPHKLWNIENRGSAPGMHFQKHDFPRCSSISADPKFPRPKNKYKNIKTLLAYYVERDVISYFLWAWRTPRVGKQFRRAQTCQAHSCRLYLLPRRGVRGVACKETAALPDLFLSPGLEPIWLSLDWGPRATGNTAPTNHLQPRSHWFLRNPLIPHLPLWLVKTWHSFLCC